MSLHIFFNISPVAEIYTLSLHDALPILSAGDAPGGEELTAEHPPGRSVGRCGPPAGRSEEHTSELQSRRDLVCRLLLEKKNTKLDNTPVLAITGTTNSDLISSNDQQDVN